jgi:polyisoprenoid-binding protein YceI
VTRTNAAEFKRVRGDDPIVDNKAGEVSSHSARHTTADPFPPSVLFVFARSSSTDSRGGSRLRHSADKKRTIKFHVHASVSIDGTFDRWDATLTFTSRDVTTGVLHTRIQADSVDTGSIIKNNTLKGADFFDVRRNP